MCGSLMYSSDILAGAMTENLLILCPTEFNAIPDDPSAMLARLNSEGFIGDSFEFNGERHYRPGEAFVSHITFLGCSPVIAMDASELSGEGFNHIAIEGPLDSPLFLSGDNLKTPRCPSCGHRFEQWQPLVEGWQQQPETHVLDCPECNRKLSAPQLRWRKCAGFGRFFIKVWGIFESEAVPSPEFIALLEEVSGCRWQHFYIRIQD